MRRPPPRRCGSGPAGQPCSLRGGVGAASSAGASAALGWPREGEGEVEVPGGPAPPARAAVGAGLGNGCSFVVFLFQHVFLLRLENGGAT